MDLAEAKRNFLAQRRDRDVPLALTKASFLSNRSIGAAARGTADPLEERLQNVRQLRQHVAMLTQDLIKSFDPSDAQNLFGDLFCGQNDGFTQLPAPPSPTTLRRVHQEHFERTAAEDAKQDLDGLLNRLADHNRSRLDAVSSIHAVGKPRRPGPVRPVEEIECQVLLSYIMQACALEQPRDSVEHPHHDAANHTASPSLQATAIVGNNSHVVAHASRVAGGRVSSGSKSSPFETNDESRSKSTPSSGARQSNHSTHRSNVSVGPRQGGSSSSKSHSSPLSGERGVNVSRTAGAVPRMGDQSAASNASTSFYGFETRGNVRFSETQEEPHETVEPVGRSHATGATDLVDDDPPEVTDPDAAAAAATTGAGTSVAEPTQTMEPETTMTANATAKSLNNSRKPTGKFAKKPQKKGFFSCLGNDAE